MRANTIVVWVVVLTACLMLAAKAQSNTAPASPNPLSCSPAPCVLPPTQASEGGQFVNTSPIVADPLDPKQLLLGGVDANCPLGGQAAFSSKDAGSSWTREVCMARLDGYLPGIFPAVGYDRKGRQYLAGQFYDDHDGGTGFIGVVSSTDGINWSTPVPALGRLNSDADFPWLVVDTNENSAFVNRVYVAGDVDGNTLDVMVAHSGDGGASWKRVVVPPSGNIAEFLNIAVGADGAVYLTWQQCPFGGLDDGCRKDKAYMLLSKSTDGGDTWTNPTLISAISVPPNSCHCGIGALPNTNDIRVYNYPVIGVDNSNGPYAGNLYVVMYSWTGTYMRVGVVRSSDGGQTWSKPVPVAPPSATHDQFFPWLSVSSTGLVGVSWLDRRNDPANVNYQAFAAISKDGGKSFQPNVQLTQAFSNPNVNGTSNDWMGDYTGNTWAGPNNFIAAWMDSSNGVDMQEVVGGIRLK